MTMRPIFRPTGDSCAAFVRGGMLFFETVDRWAGWNRDIWKCRERHAEYFVAGCTGIVCRAAKIDGIVCADDQCDAEIGLRPPLCGLIEMRALAQCPDCGGEGEWVRSDDEQMKCEECNGSGTVVVDYGDDTNG